MGGDPPQDLTDIDLILKHLATRHWSSAALSRLPCNVLLAAGMVLLGAGNSFGAPPSELTIEVGDNLLKHGGVATVYPIPVSAEEWPTAVGDNTTTRIPLDSRYAEIQLRYPKGGDYTFRFRRPAGTPDETLLATQPLSIIGVDMEDRGPQMKVGFKDAFSSGGQIIRVLPLAEIAGESEATRTMARWGETERNDAPPPADQRSARALLGILEQGSSGPALRCEGSELVQACTISDDQWPPLEARWWRAIAEQRLERLRDRALRLCYDSSWFGGGTCTADPESDEPAYIYQK